MIKTRRAYEPAKRGDGFRVLIDRLWPRGIRKKDLKLDAWLKEVAPSTDLRRWFGHDPKKWPEFGKRYKRELASPAAMHSLDELAARARKGTVTLIYSAHDADHNDAVVLKREIERRLAKALPKEKVGPSN